MRHLRLLPDPLLHVFPLPVNGPKEFVPTGRLDLYLPKFRVDSSMSLTHTLQQLGVREAFKAQAADFSRLSEQPLFISDVVHKVGSQYMRFKTTITPVHRPEGSSAVVQASNRCKGGWSFGERARSRVIWVGCSCQCNCQDNC